MVHVLHLNKVGYQFHFLFPLRTLHFVCYDVLLPFKHGMMLLTKMYSQPGIQLLNENIFFFILRKIN